MQTVLTNSIIDLLWDISNSPSETQFFSNWELKRATNKVVLLPTWRPHHEIIEFTLLSYITSDIYFSTQPLRYFSGYKFRALYSVFVWTWLSLHNFLYVDVEF